MTAATDSPSVVGDVPALTGVRVVRIGHHDPYYSRNRLTAAALRRLGVEFEDLVVPAPWRERIPALIRAVLGARKRADLLLVGFPAHTAVPVVRVFARRLPLIFDPLISLWEAAVEDRMTASPRSVAALRAWWADREAFRQSDAVVFDTGAHALWAVRRFRLPGDKFVAIPVGSPLALDHGPPRTPFYEQHEPVILFYGSYIPLHGVDVIVRAARLLEQRGHHFKLHLVGRGQTFPETGILIDSIGLKCAELMPRVGYAELMELLARADVCLGIFGTTPKASRVIPNKVYDALALGKPVITADTPAARELLVPGRHAILVRPGSPSSLADALSDLLNRPDLAQEMGARGRQLFEEKCSVDALSRHWAAVVSAVLEKH